ADMVTEARRIRDRDFKVLTDSHGNLRNWYSTKDVVKRWDDKEVDAKMADVEKQIRTQVAQQKAIEQQKQAEIDRQKQQEQANTDLTKKIDQSVPSKDQIAKAQAAAHQDGDPDQIRSAMKDQITAEIKAGTLKPEDLGKLPRVGAAFVATGALT